MQVNDVINCFDTREAQAKEKFNHHVKENSNTNLKKINDVVKQVAKLEEHVANLQKPRSVFAKPEEETLSEII